MADFFDSLPTITVILFAIGLVGVIIYERTKTKQTDETTT